MEQIRVDPLAPEFAKPHPKQESIWARQYPDGFVKARLDEYPTPELVVNAWKDGILIAQELARAVGMAPNDTFDNVARGDGDDDDDHRSGGGDGGRIGESAQVQCRGTDGSDWFYHLFRYPGNQFKKDGANSDEPDDHLDSSDEVDTTNGATCLSGNELKIYSIGIVNESRGRGTIYKGEMRKINLLAISI